MEWLVPKIIKGILLATNSLIVLAGIAVLGFGIFLYTDGRLLTGLVEQGSAVDGHGITVDLYQSAAILLIVVSCFLVIVAFVGCFGTWKENRLLLLVYYVSLLFVFVCIVAGATIAMTQSLSVIKPPLMKSLQLYNRTAKTPDVVEATKSWDSVQASFGCCGVDSYRDWNSPNSTTTVFPTPEGYEVPESCCLAYTNSLDDCRTNPDDGKYANKMHGCLAGLTFGMAKNQRNISIVTLAVIVFMFVNLVSLFCFALLLHPRNGYQMV